MPYTVKVKHIPTDQLKDMIKVDLVIASPVVDIRTIMNDFNLDICATYYDGQYFSVPHPLSAFVGTAYF